MVLSMVQKCSTNPRIRARLRELQRRKNMVLIRTKSRTYKTKFLTPKQRLESIYERNYKPSGDSETDKRVQQESESVYRELKTND